MSGADHRSETAAVVCDGSAYRLGHSEFELDRLLLRSVERRRSGCVSKLTRHSKGGCELIAASDGVVIPLGGRRCHCAFRKKDKDRDIVVEASTALPTGVQP